MENTSSNPKEPRSTAETKEGTPNPSNTRITVEEKETEGTKNPNPSDIRTGIDIHKERTIDCVQRSFSAPRGAFNVTTNYSC